jgi:F-type H+-transporting ATPase subunit delta
MAELATVARPYAEAVFRSAQQNGSLAGVGEGLAMLAAAERDPAMRSVLLNPKVTAQQKKELLHSIVGDRMDTVVKNLIGLVIDNHREALIGHIEEQFDALKHEHERVVRARITSAQPLSAQPLTDAQRDDIVAALERRYGKKIEAELDVDPQLLGGARVQVGDQVINASVRDALAQMAAALTR